MMTRSLRPALAAIALCMVIAMPASAQVVDTDTIDIGLFVHGGSETPGSSETPAPSEAPEPTDRSPGADRAPTVVKGLPGTGAVGSGTSEVAALALASLAGLALISAAVLARRRSVP